MIDSFDDLYDQIIQCERRIEEKQRQQAELRIQVQHYKDVLQRTQENLSRLHKELTLKLERMSTVELDNRSLTARERVLQTQKDSLQEELASLQLQLTSVEEELEGEMVSFCQSVEEHSEDLDLSTSGQRARQSKATSTLQRLLATEQELLRDIAQYEVHKEAIAQLEADRCCLQQSLSDAAHTKKELEECVAREEDRLQQLEEERQHVSKAPQNGEEFKRLRTELNSLHTGAMEEECARLQQQVHMLQQQLHSKQQQELRQQSARPPPPQQQQELRQQSARPPPPQQLQELRQQSARPPPPQQLQELRQQSARPPPPQQLQELRQQSARPPPPQQLLLPQEQELQCPARGESSGAGCCGGQDQGQTSSTREPVSGGLDVTDDDDDDMTLPNLDLSEVEREEAATEGLRVCNRQKPVFKPLHC